jgi:hypothetical protein
MGKECCGDTEIIQDEDGQIRCATCEKLIYDYLSGDGVSA